MGDDRAVTHDSRTSRGCIASYDDDPLFRSTITMARHGFGRGEYRYFANPLPDL